MDLTLTPTSGQLDASKLKGIECDPARFSTFFNLKQSRFCPVETSIYLEQSVIQEKLRLEASNLRLRDENSSKLFHSVRKILNMDGR